MHGEPMKESDGKFGKEHVSDRPCPSCKMSINMVVYEEWSSDCGGYEDYKYTCKACGFTWWVEGIDS